MFNIQQLINKIYRHPVSAYKQRQRFGGKAIYKKMLAGQQEMKQAAFALSPVKSYPDGLPIYFLTGRDYLYQTLFCIQSLSKICITHFRFILVDDGTFDETIIQQINKLLPDAEVVTAGQIKKNLEKILPKALYPNLHHKRCVYPHIKKLTDIHTIADNPWKLVLDSDMLFWQMPHDLINWLNNPQAPLHMIDCVESYGYTHNLMQQLCKTTVPNLLNVGAIGLESSSIKWGEIENWISVLEQQEGASYYLEQALTAMQIGNVPAVALNSDLYKVNPESLQGNKSTLHHYVDLSKRIYFIDAWKQVLNS